MVRGRAEGFAERLNELRAGAGLTQRQLAEKAGVKYGAVRDLEQGLNGPTWDTVLALAAALGVSVEAFTQPAAKRQPTAQSAPSDGTADNHFAGRLRELREAAGLTQQQLAERAGVSARTVSSLEQAVYVATWPTVLALATALGVNTSAFESAPAAKPQRRRGRPKKNP